MFRRVVVYTAVACLLGMMPLGCYSGHTISSDTFGDASRFEGWTIRAIVLNSGEVLEFERGSAPRWDPGRDEIVGRPESRIYPDSDGTQPVGERLPWMSGKECRVKVVDVRTLYLEKMNPITTGLVTIAVTVTVGLVVVAIACASWEPEFDPPASDPTSCPYVYAFDGDYYVLEGVPYVGAMCEALKSTDIFRLEHLTAVDGEYRLFVTNEANETEYIDEFTLVVVDHEPGLELVTDARGALHTIADRQRPVFAVDDRGCDWSHWLSGRDRLFWEGDGLSRDLRDPVALRDTLFFAFRVPPSATEAKVLVSGGHSLWVAAMEGPVLDLWGAEVDSFYEGLRDAGERDRFLACMAREELVDLAVRVRTPDGWQVADRVSLGGSTGAGEQVAIIGPELLSGSTLEIALAPPAGVWRVNSVTADFTPDAEVVVQELAASSAVGPDGQDLTDALRADDGVYFVQPERNTRALLSYDVPTLAPGLERTVLARATGYYSIHLDADGPARWDEIDRLMQEPGYATVFALRELHRRRRGGCELAAR